jgi:hypothetical protein
LDQPVTKILNIQNGIDQSLKNENNVILAQNNNGTLYFTFSEEMLNAISKKK